MSTELEPDDICLWPDGTSCFVDELEEFLSFMSDDYEVVKLGTSRYDEVLEEMGY